jgi:hypothetical protein
MAAQAYHNLTPRVMIFALFTARNIVKRDLCARGIKLFHVGVREVTEAAQRYLAAHPELLAQAAETDRNFPNLRTLAELQECRLRRIQQ